MSDNIVVYTAITGDKDFERNDITQINWFNKFHRHVMNAKAPKILSHQFIDADISIWVDGNIFLNIDPQKIVDEFLGDNDIAVWKHFDRNCIYDELRAVIGLGGDKPIGAEEQVARYRSLGFPVHYGLGECNVIVRRHNNIVMHFNNYWWSEVCAWSARDQLSFPFVLWNMPSIRCNFVEGNVRNHPYFKYIDHKQPYL